MAKRVLYEMIAGHLDAYVRVLARDPEVSSASSTTINEHAMNCITRSLAILESELPSGAGFDEGTRLLLDKSGPEKIVMRTRFHHMNDVGMYIGWTDHDVTVRPSLVHGIKLHISGKDRNDIKQHIADVFEITLRSEVEEPSVSFEKTG